MADFGFIGPSYEAPSIYQDAQELINWYGEADPNKAPGERGIVALYPTPGLTALLQLAANTQIRGMRTVSGGQQMVVVAGAYVYVVNSDFSANIVGTLNSVTGRVGITDNGLNVYIVDGAFRYTWRISSPASAVFVGSISGTTLTVTLMSSGTIAVGQAIYGIGMAYATVITALGTGTGGTGTYTINNSQTVVSQTLTSVLVGAVITASTSGTTLTASAVTGTLYPGQTIQGSGVTSTTIITALGTGTGSTGTYTINNSQTLTSRTLYALNFSQIPTTDGAFSGGGTVDIVDNYFVYNRPGTQQWAASDALSPITRALSFASKDGAPDNLVSMIVDHREVYLLGERSSEVWVDTGTFPFAFQRIPGTSTQHGIAAQFTMARLGNSFAYVSRNDRGQGQVVMMNGYIPQRISTHAVENSIKDQFIEDAIAWSYQLEGHEFYVVTFPSIDLTWSYDTSTGMWNKWLWVDSENVYHRHRGNCSALFQGLVLVGDWQNGKIYQLDPENYTDDEGPIRRLRRCPHLVTDFLRQYFSTLQIQFQPGVGLSGITQSISNSAIAGIALAGLAVAGTSGTEISNVNPKAMLRFSNDGGSTWSNERWVGIGALGKYQNRAIWRRLGWSRDRIFEVVVTDPVKAVIVSADLVAEAGVN
jgi:acyl CoA:acetate/3-ketoacid CoA transferase alpha subunit